MNRFDASIEYVTDYRAIITLDVWETGDWTGSMQTVEVGALCSNPKAALYEIGARYAEVAAIARNGHVERYRVKPSSPC